MSNKLKDIVQQLNNSKTEESILENLVILVKNFHPENYKDVIFSNPYYTSLLPDIQQRVISDIDHLRMAIYDEMISIDSQMLKASITDVNQLKELKRECQTLIYEIDERKKDIVKLFQN